MEELCIDGSRRRVVAWAKCIQDDLKIQLRVYRTNRNQTYRHSNYTASLHSLWVTYHCFPDTPRYRYGEGRLELLVSFLLLCHTAASDPFTTAWLNLMYLVFRFENRSASKRVFISGATTFRLPRHQPPAPRPTLLSCAREAAMCSIETHVLLSKCVHSVQRTRRCDRIACYSVLLLLCVMIA